MLQSCQPNFICKIPSQKPVRNMQQMNEHLEDDGTRVTSTDQQRSTLNKQPLRGPFWFVCLLKGLALHQT